EIELILRATGRVLACKVPSNMICARVVRMLASMAGVSLHEPEDEIGEYYLVDSRTERALDNSKTLEEAGYSSGAQMLFDKRGKRRRPGFEIHATTKKSCFPSSTLIEMADGRSNKIASLVPGDSVWCVNPHDRQLSAGPVLQITKGLVDSVVRLNKTII